MQSFGAKVEPITRDPARPVTRAVMLQGWYNLASIHWAYDPDLVQRILPDGFTVDTFDGSAWVGLLPFHMRRIRLPIGLSAGAWSTFPETNIRTYIVDPSGRRAVWFCSLDITRLAPTLIARVGYGLPYCWSRMSIDEPEPLIRNYSSARRWPSAMNAARTTVRVAIGEAVADDAVDRPLVDFLSARWALGSTFLGKLLWAEVEHPAWEMFRAELLEVDETLLEAAGLAKPTGDPVVLWSPGVEVRIGRPSLVKRPVG
jgi:uncharacterized protein